MLQRGVESGRSGEQAVYSGGHTHRNPVLGSGSLKACDRYPWPLLLEGQEDKPRLEIVQQGPLGAHIPRVTNVLKKVSSIPSGERRHKGPAPIASSHRLLHNRACAPDMEGDVYKVQHSSILYSVFIPDTLGVR